MSFLTSIRSSMPRLTDAGSRYFSTSRPSQVAKLTVVGRLAAQPELVTTATGRELVRYAVGTNKGVGDSQTTTWWKIASFAEAGAGRERLLSLGKGSLVYVEGEASMSKYEVEGGKTAQGLNVIQTKLDVLKRNDASSTPEHIVEED